MNTITVATTKLNFSVRVQHSSRSKSIVYIIGFSQTKGQRKTITKKLKKQKNTRKIGAVQTNKSNWEFGFAR